MIKRREASHSGAAFQFAMAAHADCDATTMSTPGGGVTVLSGLDAERMSSGAASETFAEAGKTTAP